jgi:hypothetical protein
MTLYAVAYKSLTGKVLRTWTLQYFSKKITVLFTSSIPILEILEPHTRDVLSIFDLISTFEVFDRSFCYMEKFSAAPRTKST